MKRTRWWLGGLVVCVACSATSSTQPDDDGRGGEGGQGGESGSTSTQNQGGGSNGASALDDAGTPTNVDATQVAVECVTEDDCEVPTTVPESCAEAVCQAGVCSYVARDKDDDGFPSRRCSSRVPGVAVVTGADCDDGDPDVNPNAWDGPESDEFGDGCGDDIDQDCNGLVDDGRLEDGTSCTCEPGQTGSCATTEVGFPLQYPELVDGAPLGACRLGSRECLPNGTWGQCTGAIGPSAETCDGSDNDCDGIASLEDIDDVIDMNVYACDADNDGYLPARDAVRITACSEPSDDCGDGGRWISNPLPGAFADCDDDDPTQFPGNIELCDGVDNNCNGRVDDNPPNAPTWSYDADGDSFRATANEILQQCEPPDAAPASCVGDCPDDAWTDVILTTGDCDDDDPQINPSARDACDGVDYDCDGSPLTGCACDETDPPQACLTHPGFDGVGVCMAGEVRCVGGTWTSCVGSVGPGDERCGTADLDCDGTMGSEDDNAVDREVYACDADGDGHLPAVGATQVASCSAPTEPCGSGAGVWLARPQPGLFDDCDDTDPLRYPGKAETCDGVDNDCDGTPDDLAIDAIVWSYDPDGDGERSPTAAPVRQCAPPTTPPSGCTVCVSGADAWTGLGSALKASDCDESNPQINSAGIDRCDGTDWDCDGSALTGCTCTVGDPAQECGAHPGLDGFGVCQAGAEECVGGEGGGCIGSIGPAYERCGTTDHDCDGTPGNADADSVDRALFVCDEDGDGYVRATGALTATACSPEFIPAVIDDQCPGTWMRQPPPSRYTDCDDDDDSANPAAVELCDGVDNDCDGVVDTDALGKTTWSYDADGDGFRDTMFPSVTQCFAPTEPPAGCVGCPSGAQYWTGLGGALPSGDCNDANASINPAAADRCDGTDWNCDGSTLTGCDCQTGQTQACGTHPGLDGTGVCRAGEETCIGGQWGACIGSVGPSLEQCGTIDYDCDGTPGNTDPGNGDGSIVTAGQTSFACDVDSDGFIAMSGAATTMACGLAYITAPCGGAWRAGPATGADCDDANARAFPFATERCGAADLDCDGTAGSADPDAADQGTYVCDADGDGRLADSGTPLVVTQCGAPTSGCDGDWLLNPASSFYDDCDDTDPDVSPVGALEVCDGKDNDCDGEIDVGSVDEVVWSYDGDRDGFRDETFDALTQCDAPTLAPDGCTGCPDGAEYWKSGAGELPDGDCNDGNSAINPAAFDRCNGVDYDCDGSALTGCDCTIGSSRACDTHTEDGTGVCKAGLETCIGGQWGVCVGAVGPTQEQCGSVDYDCDGTAGNSDSDAAGTTTFTCDADGDGFIATSGAATTTACGAAFITDPCAGTWRAGPTTGTDCDDTNPRRFPGATEFCGAVDFDCDGTAGSSDPDATNQGTYVCDADGDGRLAASGSPATVTQCGAPTSGCTGDWLLNPASSFYDDCDDTDPDVSPVGMLEVCDGKDNDCDGTADNGAVDELVWSYDRDLDGFRDDAFDTITQCEAPTVAPAGCTGCPDGSIYWSGGTGELPDGDCNDASGNINPAAFDRCNGIDYDCDGSALTGCACTIGDTRACDPHPEDGTGVCKAGVETCTGGQWGVCIGAVGPTSEQCGGFDLDCDGVVGNSDPTAAGQTPFTCDADGDGFIATSGAATTTACGVAFITAPCAGRWAAGPTTGTDCDDTNPQRYLGATERCGAVDLDCDGTAGSSDPDAIDQSTFVCDADADGRLADSGSPATATQCSEPTSGCAGDWIRNPGSSFFDDCDDTDPTVSPVSAPEICDGKDNDCNDLTDEDDDTLVGRPYTVDTVYECDFDDSDPFDVQTWVITSCPTNTENCDGNYQTACDTNLLNNDDDCGGCGVSCDLTCDGLACDDIVDVSAGDDHACGIRQSGKVVCWGSNARGQLGDGTTTNRATPVEVVGLTGVTRISAGVSHTCAVTEIGAIYCWGDNTHGQTGQAPTAAAQTVPMAVTLADATHVAAGTNNTCAISGTGSLWCWGLNDFGQIGNEDDTTEWIPRAVVDGTSTAIVDAIDVSAGNNFACAVRTGGGVVCWGINDSTQLGDGPTDHDDAYCDSLFIDCSRHAVPVTGITSATHVSNGQRFACARTPTNVLCWGRNSQRQILNTTTTTYNTPQVSAGAATRVSTGVANTCAILNTGATHCWGDNQSGQLGRGPIGAGPFGAGPVNLLTDATALGVGKYFACAVRQSGPTVCWGDDTLSQLGNGNPPSNVDEPVSVSRL